MDNTTVHPSSAHQIQHIDLHLWRGAPENLDLDRPIQILVNHGYVVGFCPDRLQPAWSAYRVAHADDDVDYDRPHVYYEDMRLDSEHRIGPETFGKIGGIQLHVGHMSPNEVINRQFGRLAQMETFFMSNMSPQYGSLNTGVWLKLENAIREIEDTNQKDHVWAIVGPIFSDTPSYISLKGNKKVPVPKSYFCITIDPHSYPYKYPSNVSMDCFIIPQEAPRDSNPIDYPATLEEIQNATNLKFFTKWGREFPQEFIAQRSAPVKSRLQLILEKNKAIEQIAKEALANSKDEAKSIQDLIDSLKAESDIIRNSHKELNNDQLQHLETIQHTISHLLQAQLIAKTERESDNDLEPLVEEEQPANFVTYKIEDDIGDKLKKTVRTACNFWNRFVSPKFSIVIRLGLFSQNSNTIARAYKPYEKDNVKYGKVEFNTKFLNQYPDNAIIGTIIHEIGHTLGFGWQEWQSLFNHNTGEFKAKAIKRLSELAIMEVELDGGDGTAKSHWDEEKFRNELMTGYKDPDEFVLPITIDVMELLGHEVIDRLPIATNLAELIIEVEGVVFSRQNEAKALDLDYYQETEIFEIFDTNEIKIEN